MIIAGAFVIGAFMLLARRDRSMVDITIAVTILFLVMAHAF